MAQSLTLDGTEALNATGATGDEWLDDEEFELDLRVVEAATPVAFTMCDTSDGCGDTCSTSACSSSSYDPA
jgi:FxLD family lantipeptide